MTDHNTILYIEDEPDILMMYRVKFKAAGFNFLEAATAPEGLLLAKEKKPDLILLDIKLNMMSGLDVLKHLKEDITTKDIPVFLFSNAYQTENEKRGLELGAERFILKTKVLPAEMVVIVRDRLAQK